MPELVHPSLVDDALRKFGVTGASFAVLKPTGDGDSVVCTQVAGLASRETSTPVFDSTWFEIASLSKPIAAVFAYQYFSDRGISFDTSVNALLAEAGSPYRLVSAEGCPREWADEVTLTHLMDHTGPQMHYVNGIPRSQEFPSMLALISGRSDAPAPHGYAPLFVTKRPGLVFGYSGGGFLILQHLLETREKTPMAALMDEHLAACGTSCALGLSFAHESPGKHYADGYRDDGTRVDGGRLNFPPLAAGALGSSAALLDWLRQLALAYRRPGGCGGISHAAARCVLTRRPDCGSEAFMSAGMGVGMFVFDVASEDGARPNRWMLHQAANDGFRGVLLVCFDGPDADRGPRGLVVLVNGDNQGMLCVASITRSLLGSASAFAPALQGVELGRCPPMDAGFSMEGLQQAEIVNLGFKGLVLPAFVKVAVPAPPPPPPPSVPTAGPPPPSAADSTAGPPPAAGSVAAALAAAAATPLACVVIVGGCYLDEIHHVPAYPAEDTAVRATHVRRRRGGNAANSAVVAAQMLHASGAATRLCWMGAVPPRATVPETDFVLGDLEGHGVDTSLREEVAEVAAGAQGAAAGALLPGVPTSAIVQSRASGSRTIVSCRRGLRELSPAHLSARLPAPAPGKRGFVHFEGREVVSVGAMTRAVQARRAAGEAWQISIELEKPAISLSDALALIEHADVAYFSREWVEKHAAELHVEPGAHDGAHGAHDGAIGDHDGARGAHDGAMGAHDGVDLRGHLAVRTLIALGTRAKRRAEQGGADASAHDGADTSAHDGAYASYHPRRPALWVCAWGSTGAFAVELRGAELGAAPEPIAYYEPARRVEQVVDSTGAGDTFIGSSLAAIATGAPPQEALRRGCAVAARKVGQEGLAGLAGAYL
jgi:sugar/nucleoside kinase (ribokinase family)/CubicO group peptidase (beta-lactamase class C family)